MEKMISELKANGIECRTANGGFVALYRENNTQIGCYKVYYNEKGAYIRYNQIDYYLY